MRALTALLLVSLTTPLFADYISIRCGKNADAFNTADIAYAATSVVPEERDQWELALKGKNNKKAESIVIKQSEYSTTGYIITEKKPASGKTYRQFIFSKTDNCMEGGPAYVQVYQVGGGEGRQPIGSRLKCQCDID